MTMRVCIDFKIPQVSVDRLSADTLTPVLKMYKRKYPEYLLKAIDWATAIEPSDRPQSIEELQQALQA